MFSAGTELVLEIEEECQAWLRVSAPDAVESAGDFVRLLRDIELHE